MKKILLLIRFYNFKKELDVQIISPVHERKNTAPRFKWFYKENICMPSFKVYPKRIFHENKSSIKDGFYKILVFNVSIFFFSAE